MHFGITPRTMQIQNITKPKPSLSLTLTLRSSFRVSLSYRNPSSESGSFFFPLVAHFIHSLLAGSTGFRTNPISPHYQVSFVSLFFCSHSVSWKPLPYFVCFPVECRGSAPISCLLCVLFWLGARLVKLEMQNFYCTRPGWFDLNPIFDDSDVYWSKYS